MQERRQASRFRLNLPSRWESLRAQGRGTICDLSETGCFVLSDARLKPNELVRLEIQFPHHLVFAWGQAVYGVREMGFAVRFMFGEESEARAVRKLIEKLR